MPPTTSQTQEGVGGQTPTTLTTEQRVAQDFQTPPPGLAPPPAEVVTHPAVHPGGTTSVTGRRASATDELKAFMSFRPPNFDATPMSVGPQRFIDSQRDALHDQFEKLHQNDMTVAQYDAEFTRLSCYGFEIIPTEENRVKRFVNGLIKSHRTALATEGKGSSRPPQLASHNHSQHSPSSQSAPQRQGQQQHQRRSSFQNMAYHCSSCGKNHSGRCMRSFTGCYTCGEQGHLSFACPRVVGAVQSAAQQQGAIAAPPIAAVPARAVPQAGRGAAR
ncbi:uncharacterized protein LOC132607680 [Lycium barbarum]|uniref:uncharacterized protein LOC132607680 n=1 Tax=Lycium barbarum TaxID=112863 RepID=UPI00293F40C3|nr:uncharacterized protein LOC132607680 [Lycium barbarum]